MNFVVRSKNMKSIIYGFLKLITNFTLVIVLAHFSGLTIDTVLLWVLFGYVIYLDTRTKIKELP